jgi:hypothetical protein
VQIHTVFLHYQPVRPSAGRSGKSNVRKQYDQLFVTQKDFESFARRSRKKDSCVKRSRSKFHFAVNSEIAYNTRRRTYVARRARVKHHIMLQGRCIQPSLITQQRISLKAPPRL